MISSSSMQWTLCVLQGFYSGYRTPWSEQALQCGQHGLWRLSAGFNCKGLSGPLVHRVSTTSQLK